MSTDRIVDITMHEHDFLEESNLIEGVDDPVMMQQAIFAWEYIRGAKEMDIGTLLKTHKILMLHSKLKPDEKGYLRTKGASIGKTEIIGIDPDGEHLLTRWVKIRDCMPPKNIRPNLQTLTEAVNRLTAVEKQDIAAIIARQQHVQFEYIHPFVDGNGRIGRMLLNWTRLRVGLPIIIILNSEKKAYYEWFKEPVNLPRPHKTRIPKKVGKLPSNSW